MDEPRLAGGFLFPDRPRHRVRHLLRALRLHVHSLGAAQHGPEPGRSRRDFRRQRNIDAVFGDVPADHAGDHLRHAVVVHRHARHLRHSGGARRADQYQRAHHLYLQAHQLVAAALQHRGGGRDHPDGGDRRAGFSPAKNSVGTQLHHRRRQGLPAAQSGSGSLALAHLRLRHLLSDRCGCAAAAGLDRGGVPQVHVHPRCGQPVRHAAILAGALQQYFRQSADASIHVQRGRSRHHHRRGRRRARLCHRLHHSSLAGAGPPLHRSPVDLAGGHSGAGDRRRLPVGLDRHSRRTLWDDLDFGAGLHRPFHAGHGQGAVDLVPANSSRVGRSRLGLRQRHARHHPHHRAAAGQSRRDRGDDASVRAGDPRIGLVAVSLHQQHHGDVGATARLLRRRQSRKDRCIQSGTDDSTRRVDWGRELAVAPAQDKKNQREDWL
jgi:hypothetical protein